MRSEVSRVRFYFICLVAGLLLCSCGPKRAVFSSDPAFPPKANAAIRLFLAAPVDSMDLSPARDDMISHSEGDPARALEKAKCIWDKGLEDVTHHFSEGTDLESGILADASPYPPTSQWIRYTSDALSIPSFSIVDPAVLSKFQADGFDYVAVPQDLSVRSGAAGGIEAVTAQAIYYSRVREELYFETPVAVVDVKKNEVVWTGVVSSPRSKLEIRGSSVIAKEAYDWLCDLLAVLGRNVRDPGTRFESCK